MNDFNYFKRQQTQMYTVKPGDNLYSIANAHKVSVEEIMKLNKLSNSTIYPNQVLKIPVITNNGMQYNEYVTVSGDTLETIQQKSGVSYDILKQYNDITKLQLVPNQVIKLPKSQAKTYVIKPGDDLDEILDQFGITERDLILLNASKCLKPGEEIIVG